MVDLRYSLQGIENGRASGEDITPVKLYKNTTRAVQLDVPRKQRYIDDFIKAIVDLQ